MACKFQSTLPTRGSDAQRACFKDQAARISIHAPHEGERQTTTYRLFRHTKISIHAPHEGERLSRGISP